MRKLPRLPRRCTACRCIAVPLVLAFVLPLTASAACLTATAGGAWQTAGFSTQTSTFTVTFDATPSASPTNSVVGLSDGTQTSYTGYACLIRFNPSGDIDARNGGSYAAASTIPYSANATYHCRIVANVPAHTYSAYVTPPGGSEITVGANYGFRTEQNTVPALNAWGVYVNSTSSGGAGTTAVCNFALALPAAATPTFTPAAGTYSSAQSVSISSATTGASIRYTTDGSTPSETAGALYSSPVTVSSTTTLKAIAYESGYTDSAVSSAAYTIQSGTTGNIAPSGAAYGWFGMSSSTATANQNALPGLNDGNVTTNVDLDPAGDSIGAWEGGGVIWSSAVTISSVDFINGDITSGGDGFLTANLTLQFTTNGTTWTNSGWTCSPAYPYSSSAGGHTYTFSGTAVNGILGARVVGQVRTTDTSYHWILKEFQVTGTTGSGSTSFTITASAGTGGTITPSGPVSVAQGANQTFTITPNSGYTIASVTVDNANVGAVTSYTFSNVQANHTIGAAFNSSGGGQVADPTFSPGPGSYSSAQNVTIASATAGASIRYTLDGSTPSSTAGTLYTGPVAIASSTTLNAIAYESGFTSSNVTGGFYSIGSSGSVTTTGSISFHLLLGVSSAQDSLTLTGDNYTDLIMSNVIAGVMYSHIVQEYFPGIQFNQDYLDGSIFGQLLQENLATQDYTASTNLIDPSPDQQAVMGSGQGGPYQINNYAIDMVSGSYTPQGHSLINYIAVQKNIGYTMATASTQYSQPTPPSFNNKYYGPMLCSFFHYNDMVALNVIGKGPNGWTTPWEPAYDQAMANFVNLPNSFLDVILNVAYNQGYYGTLVPHYSQLGATATSSTVASVNSYSSVWGSTDTYQQYPYQVHYYLDELFDNPIPTTSPSNTVTPTNHIAFAMGTLANVFSNVAQTLSYSNGTDPAQFFTASQAQAAFASALSQQGVSSTATLDLSRASDRMTIYHVIDSALSYLESVGGMKFNSTTNSQL